MIALACSPVAPGPRARLISPLQAALGTFFGGPIGFAFFSRANCVAIGDRAGARKMLALSLAVLLVWHAAVAIALFEGASLALDVLFGGTPFALMITAHRIAERQVAKAPDPSVFRSTWKIVGIATLCCIASAVCALGVIAVAILARLATSGFRT